MPFGDENFFYASGNPQMDAFVAQQLANQNAPKRSRKSAWVAPQGIGHPVGGNMFDNGFGAAMGGFNTAMGMSAMQGNLLQGMIDQTTDAIDKENYSRVAQAREQNRMDHEKELMAMRMGGDKDQEIKQLREIIKELRAQMARGQVSPLAGGGWVKSTWFG